MFSNVIVIFLPPFDFVPVFDSSAQALLYNQPMVVPQPDGSAVVAVHALLALPNISRPAGQPPRRLTAPEYLVKLKRPAGIAEVR